MDNNGRVRQLSAEEAQQLLNERPENTWVIASDAASIELRQVAADESIMQSLAGKEARVFCPEWELRLKPQSPVTHEAWLYEEDSNDGEYGVRDTRLLLWGTGVKFADGTIRLREVRAKGAISARVIEEGKPHCLIARHYCEKATGMVVLTRYCEVKVDG